MEQHVFGRRRVAGGLACVAAGALALAMGAAPAGATEGPEVEAGSGWSGDQLVDQLADQFGGDWAQAETPMQSGHYLLDDRGTADTGDDAYADVHVDGDEVSWSSDDQSIGAVEVQDDSGSNLYTWGGQAAHSGHGMTWPGMGDSGDSGGWGDWGDHESDHGDHSISFCWKKGGHDHPSTTAPPTSETPSTAPPTSETPTSESPSTAPPSTEAPTTAPSTESTEAPTTLPETEATTPTTQPMGEQLPRTGSNTAPLLAGAVALVALGGAAFAGRRYLQQRAS